MTCIVGVIDKGRVWMGGDSAGVSGDSIAYRKDPKVFKVGEFLFGFTSSFRMGQLLQFKFKPPERKNQTHYRYMVTTFVDEIKKCFKENGYQRTSDGRDSGGEFLVGYQGHLFHIESDYQVGESRFEYDACGAGEEYALGALHATGDTEGRARVKAALVASELFCASVARPFIIQSINHS